LPFTFSMTERLEYLLNTIEFGQQEEKINCLIDITYFFKSAYPGKEDFTAVVQRLIFLLTKEKDDAVRSQFFKTLYNAYLQPVDLSTISYGPLLHGLDSKDTIFIRNVLDLLSMTWDKKYKNIFAKYMSHPDEKLRTEALEIFVLWS
jgi:hypothetical protein